MNRKIFALPVVVALAVLIGSQMFAPTQPQAQAPVWDVTTIDLPFLPPAPPVVTPKVPPSDGAGYQPKADPKCECVNCNCDELEKRVAALEVKVNAYGSSRPASSNGSSGVTNYGSTGSGPMAGSPPLPYGSTFVSERVVSRSAAAPMMQMQPAQPVRNVARAAVRGTCRVVNGVLVDCDK
jgi:hypothetical protein